MQLERVQVDHVEIALGVVRDDHPAWRGNPGARLMDEMYDVVARRQRTRCSGGWSSRIPPIMIMRTRVRARLLMDHMLYFQCRLMAIDADRAGLPTGDAIRRSGCRNVAILKSGISLPAFPIYACGAAEAQAVGSPTTANKGDRDFIDSRCIIKIGEAISSHPYLPSLHHLACLF